MELNINKENDLNAGNLDGENVHSEGNKIIEDNLESNNEILNIQDEDLNNTPLKKTKILRETTLVRKFKKAIDHSDKQSAEEKSEEIDGDPPLSDNILNQEIDITVNHINENEISKKDPPKCSSRGKRRKSSKKKFPKNKKLKLSADLDKAQHDDEPLIEVIERQEDERVITHQEDGPEKIENIETKAESSSSSNKKSTKEGERSRKRKKNKMDDSKVELELKLLKNAVSSLTESFNNFQELAINKLISNEENWRQLKSTKETPGEMPVDLNNIRRAPPVGYIRLDDDKIHLGRGVWLAKKTYDNDVYNARSSLSMFVKNIAVSVFGAEYLKSHSVTGRGSNKTKSTPRPAIDSTKALAIQDIYTYYLRKEKNFSETEAQEEADRYDEYIRQKISDLIRPPRVAKKDGKEGTADAEHGGKHNSAVKKIDVLPSTSSTSIDIQKKDSSSDSSSESDDDDSGTSSDEDIEVDGAMSNEGINRMK